MLAVDECCRRDGDSRSNAGTEITLDARFDLRRSPVPFEEFQIEPEVLGEGPEMWIVGTASVGEESIDESPELTLACRSLGGSMENRGARMLRGNRKVPHADLQREIRESAPDRCAVWTAEICVESHGQPLPP